MSVKLSVYMLTFNNADTVEIALKSLTFADEIVVVDSFSTDGTMDIVKQYTDKVFQRAWPGFREQYKFAHEHCANNWRMFIDADEEISEAMAKEILETLSTNEKLPKEERVHGFYAQRRTFFLNKWILHGGWVPDREVRLYDSRHGDWKGDLHACIHVDGTVKELKNYYYHYSFADLNAQLEKTIHYSNVASDDLNKAGKKGTPFRMVGRAVARFFKEYFIKRGFLDGVPGLIIAVNSSFYVFTKYAKLWERQNCSPELTEKVKREDRP